MTKIFICDKCSKEFPQPLDEEKYKDIHGEWHVFDLCAPCRADLKVERGKPDKEFLGKLVKKKGK